MRNQAFTEGNAGKRLFSVLLVRMLLKSHSQTFQGRIPPVMLHFVVYPESTGRSLMYLWLRRLIFTAFVMFLTTLENGPDRVIMSQYESSNRNRQVVVTKSSEFRVGCPIILFFEQISDDHRYPGRSVCRLG